LVSLLRSFQISLKPLLPLPVVHIVIFLPIAAHSDLEAAASLGNELAHLGDIDERHAVIEREALLSWRYWAEQ
jgi:hypothetical protein